MKKNILLEKTFAFSLRIIKLYRFMNAKKDFALANQIIRSGTSIGANVEEAMGASSYQDFKVKIEIAYKEARETSYWLRLFKDSEILEARLADSLHSDCEELLKLIGTILNTVKRNLSLKNNPIPNS